MMRIWRIQRIPRTTVHVRRRLHPSTRDRCDPFDPLDPYHRSFRLLTLLCPDSARRFE